VNSIAIKPTPTNTLHRLLDEAKSKVEYIIENGGTPPVDLDEGNLEAMTMFEALRSSLEEADTIKGAQAVLVAECARKELYLAHPTIACGSMREFLKAAGFRGSQLHDLYWTSEIVMWCDAHKIDIDPYLLPARYPKLVEGLTYAKKCVEANGEGGAEKLQSTLLADIDEAVERGVGRSFIRRKYREHGKHGILAQGAVNKVNGFKVITLVLEDRDTVVEHFLRRLNSSVAWELLATKGKVTEHSAQILINLPGQIAE